MAISFFIIALVYAAVGFGGGSSYTALLAAFNTDYTILPIISLVCNVIVVTGGTWRHHKLGHIPWRRIWPLFATSVPMAWFGGQLLVNEHLFTIILGVALFTSGIAMLMQKHQTNNTAMTTSGSLLLMPIVGGILGTIAGMVGIGGGIFLAPILHIINWANSRNIAGICSSFILINSVAGLTGQFSKLNSYSELSPILNYWPLFLAVLLGGQLGSFFGTKRLNLKTIKLITATLVLLVSIRILYQAWGLQ